MSASMKRTPLQIWKSTLWSRASAGSAKMQLRTFSGSGAPSGHNSCRRMVPFTNTQQRPSVKESTLRLSNSEIPADTEPGPWAHAAALSLLILIAINSVNSLWSVSLATCSKAPGEQPAAQTGGSSSMLCTPTT